VGRRTGLARERGWDQFQPFPSSSYPGRLPEGPGALSHRPFAGHITNESTHPLSRRARSRVRPEPRRPKYHYRVRIREAKDVEVARKRGLGMFLLTGEVPTKFHYPMHFGPTVVLDERLVPVVDTKMRTIAFRDANELRNPTFEALVAMMLDVDEIAAGSCSCGTPASIRAGWRSLSPEIDSTVKRPPCGSRSSLPGSRSLARCCPSEPSTPRTGRTSGDPRMGEFSKVFLEELVEVLRRNQIDYIVVGGQAVAEQAPSHTDDLDVLVALREFDGAIARLGNEPLFGFPDRRKWIAKYEVHSGITTRSTRTSTC
jgi:hypothetical protein